MKLDFWGCDSVWVFFNSTVGDSNVWPGLRTADLASNTYLYYIP